MTERSERIGVGIVTCNRKPGLLRLYQSLPRHQIDALIIVNDGEPDAAYQQLAATLVQNEENQGVGRSKNTALRYLQQQDIEHFFLIEDDIYIKDPRVFERYITAAAETGIQHFNFALHGPYNVTDDGVPRPRLQVNYPSFCLPLYPSCVGAFSYYSRCCLQQAGLMDEVFYNALEHVEHTWRIIEAGMHPPYSYFADIEDSGNYLGDEGWSTSQSTICRQMTFRAVCLAAAMQFNAKYGYMLSELPVPEPDIALRVLRTIRQRFSRCV
ncbi:MULTISPECIES: glycosyltransferase [unclassified Tatumella]|uniref:glycosyltransferase n=1 Tax=unclassified Tatumella TaxID=2649542 RepID=UPI001BAFCB1E|nr:MULTISPECIES: glycosyltransferase [unclassified Tatumella]MBS0877184.1 glycosyltransferase [Tatumella sp. JGM82]MBS0889447.1 glycosyltransferase [Tatumella sp. JGM94]MBS0901581.1 glycosyltransferase [Tatumella sp. JGM100]